MNKPKSDNHAPNSDLTDTNNPRGLKPEPNIYDSVFKTVVQKLPGLVVPLVNEAFGRSHGPDEVVELLPLEYEEAYHRVLADCVVRIGGNVYHIECQSSTDARMPIRMIEYDVAIGLATIEKDGAYTMKFPESSVVYLRASEREPEMPAIHVELPWGESFDYRCRTLGAQSFSEDELFEKGLLALLPFFLMRYEHDLREIASDEGRTRELLDELSSMRASLESAALAAGDSGLYNELVALSVRVSDHLLRRDEEFGEKVRTAMGGEVLLLLSEERELAIKEATEQGLKQGLEQGREQGREQALVDLARKGLLDRPTAAKELGISEAELAERMASLG